jgi:hypothetical protein
MADWLIGRGHGVWIDRDMIHGGAYFGTEIARGLAAARVVVFACSPASLASEMCFRELALAADLGVYDLVPVWLLRPAGRVVEAYPERFRLLLSPKQCIFADDPQGRWRQEVLAALQKLGLRPAPTPGATKEEYVAACKAGQWARVIALGDALRTARPDLAATIDRNAEIAGRRLAEQREGLLARLRGRPTPADWEEYLAAYPDGARADHARFRLACDSPLARLGPIVSRCDRGGADPGWAVAGAIARLRLRDTASAVATLERVRSADPVNAAAAFFLAVGLVAAAGVGRLTLGRLNRPNELLETAQRLAPECAYPALLSALLAREYYEPRCMAGPFGPSAELYRRALAGGLTQSEYTALERCILG